MSGGHFDHQQYRLNDLAREVERLIDTNGQKDWRNFKPETLAKFQEAITVLRKGEEMLQRIDWLVSGDDGEESFHKRWNIQIPERSELSKIIDAVEELIKPEFIIDWLQNPNEAFGGAIPLKMIELGNTSCIWEMIDRLRSGTPS